MSEFFELRIYQVFPGRMTEWLEFMEKTIIPFQVSKGMIIHGSFREISCDKFYLNNKKREMETLKDRNLYIWIRRFKNLNHKKTLYKKVYESEEWVKKIAPRVETLINRNTIVVHNICPTALSIMK